MTEAGAGAINEARAELAHAFMALLRAAPTATVPFFGNAQQFRDVAGDKVIVEVDPARITSQFPLRKTIVGTPVTFADHYFGKGDWTPHLERLERSTVYREIADLLAHGLDYRAAPIHAELLQRIAAGRPPIRNLVTLDTPQKLDLYFEKVVELIVSIRDTGYRRRPRYQGLESAEEASRHSSEVRPVMIELTESEIGAAIGIDGSLHRLGPGTHRFAIARQLGLKRVPVEVRLLHVQWARKVIGQDPRPLHMIFEAVRGLGSTLQPIAPQQAPALQESAR